MATPHEKKANHAIEYKLYPKKFEGTTYYFFDNYQSKLVAKEVVKRLREFGYSARATKLFAGYFANESGYVYSVYVKRRK